MRTTSTAPRRTTRAAAVLVAMMTAGACAPETPPTPPPPPPQVPGNPDLTFDPGSNTGVVEFGVGQPAGVSDAVEAANGDVFLIGSAGNPGAEKWWWKRVGADGRADAPTRSLQHPSGIGKAKALATLPDGSHLIGGYLEDDGVIVKTDADGVLDPTFGIGGRVTLDLSPGFDDVTGIAIGPNDEILVGLMLDDRWTADFNTNVIPWRLDNLVGPLPHLAIARLTATGALDPTYGTGGLFELPAPALAEAPYLIMKGVNFTSLVALDDGSVIAAGAASRNLDLFKVTPTGALDTGYGTGGVTRLIADDIYGTIPPNLAGVIPQIHSARLHARDGGGVMTSFAMQGFNGSRRTTVAWDDAGQLDPSFGGGDGILPTIGGTHLEMLPAGAYSWVAGGASVGRYTADGGNDVTFGTGGSLPLNVVQPPSTGMYATTFRAGWHHVRDDGKITVAGLKVYVRRDLLGIERTTYNIAVARILTA